MGYAIELFLTNFRIQSDFEQKLKYIPGGSGLDNFERL